MQLVDCVTTASTSTLPTLSTTKQLQLMNRTSPRVLLLAKLLPSTKTFLLFMIIATFSKLASSIQRNTLLNLRKSKFSTITSIPITYNPHAFQTARFRTRLYSESAIDLNNVDTKIGNENTVPITKKQGGKGKKKEGDSKYSKTVLLPVTSFDQRANSLKREPELQKFWYDSQIYEKLAENNLGDKFILHDGPPYANGDLHIGNVNRLLIDMFECVYVNKLVDFIGNVTTKNCSCVCMCLLLRIKNSKFI